MKAIDETGNRYGGLTVISFVQMKPKGKWLCKCDCGGEKLVYGSDLRSGKVTSCGCRINSSVLETPGTKYGYLTILERDPTPPKEFADRCIHWRCLCSLCGNTVSVSGKSLRNGDTRSCGCMKSAGEQTISETLIKNNIPFKRECKFKDLKGDALPLRFDFQVLNAEDGSQNMLIEFQGPQHFKDTGFYKDVSLEKRIEYDLLKEYYCEENKFNLIIFIQGNKSPLDQRQIIEKEILEQYRLNKETKNYGKISYISL